MKRIQCVLRSCRTPKILCSQHALLTGAGDWGPSLAPLLLTSGRPLGIGAPWCQDDGPGGRHTPHGKAVLMLGLNSKSDFLTVQS